MESKESFQEGKREREGKHCCDDEKDYGDWDDGGKEKDNEEGTDSDEEVSWRLGPEAVVVKYHCFPQNYMLRAHGRPPCPEPSCTFLPRHT